MTGGRACAAAVALLVAAAGLPGCSSLGALLDPPPRPTAGASGPDSAPVSPLSPVAGAASAAAEGKQGVRVQIEAAGNLKTLLERYLDIVRLGKLAREDVDDAEWSRLIDTTPAQVRELLQTEGYFNPQVKMEREGAAAGETTDIVRLQVDSGPQARVERVTLEVEGELERGAAAGDLQSRAALEGLRKNWNLPAGSLFRNAIWSSAKAAALTRMRAAGYATAGWSGTKADVDAEHNTVRLFMVADSGPLFRFGDLAIEGLVTQDAQTVLNLASLTPGAPMTEAALVDFQDRLQKAGLFENISITLDTDPEQAAHARVTARLREAPLQTYTIGLGISANTGPRFSVDQAWRRVFGLPLLMRNKITYGQLDKLWNGEISSHVGESLYRDLVGAAVEQLKSDTDVVLTQSVRVGRTQEGQRIERLLYIEAERSLRKTNDLLVRTNAVALSLNYHGVWRDLDSVLLPTQGFSLNGQVGGGYSHGSNAEPGPFTRVYLRFTGYEPVGRSWYSQARLEVGQVFLRGDHVVPESQQFRAGGEDSVRGYSYRSLGPLVDGSVGSGNALFTLSGELARPISSSYPSLWGATFIDLGNAANDFSSLHPAVGVGVGLRWRSPVGPLRLDYAYGRETKKSRLYFSVGIAF